MIHIVKGFSVVSEAEIDVFLEFPCFLCDPTNVGNLISAFSKPRLYIWKLSVHELLKPSLKDFEHNFDGMWSEPSCMIVCTSLALPLFGIGMKTDLFQSCGHCWVFHICWHTEYSTLATLSSSSTGILSPPLALFWVMFLVVLPTWLHTPGSLALGEWPHHRAYSGSWRSFLHSSSVCSCRCWISSASVRSIVFPSWLCPSLHEMSSW